MRVEIYTDGACIGNPGPGGWAALIRSARREKLISGGYQLTTNNRMELTAVIKALGEVPDDTQLIDLYSDSRYVVEAIEQGWADSWAAKKWKKSANKPVPNADLWKKLLALLALKPVNWHWVKGHAGHPENERVDQAAQREAALNPQEIDTGYIEENEPLLSLPLFSGPEVTSLAQGRGAVKKAGDVCRRCGEKVEKRVPKRKVNPNQYYYYAYYFQCPGCKTIYYTEDAKRSLT